MSSNERIHRQADMADGIAVAERLREIGHDVQLERDCTMEPYHFALIWQNRECLAERKLGPWMVNGRPERSRAALYEAALAELESRR